MRKQLEPLGGSRRSCRVLFSTLSQLTFNSPLTQEEPLSIAAVIELMKKSNATSLFLDTRGPTEEGVGNIFDIILYTDKSTGYHKIPGKEVKFYVSHSGPSNADRTEKIVRREERKNVKTGDLEGYLILDDGPENKI